MCHPPPFPPLAAGALHMSADAEAEGPPGEEAGEEEEAGEQDPRLYSVRISRVTGIEWGTDLSFSWVYVRALQPSGAAANCGEVSVGDQVGFRPRTCFFFRQIKSNKY